MQRTRMVAWLVSLMGAVATTTSFAELALYPSSPSIHTEAQPELLAAAARRLTQKDKPEKTGKKSKHKQEKPGQTPGNEPEAKPQSTPVLLPGEEPMKSTHIYVANSKIPDQQSLDLYAPRNLPPGSKLPIVAYVHGGGLTKGDKENTKGKDITFTASGYLLASVNYRLSSDDTKVMYPAHIQDVASAVAWLHAHAAEFGGDPNRIFLMGHSMGAGQVALVSTDEQFLGANGLKLDVLKGTICLDGGFYDLQERSKRDSSREVIENSYGSDPDVWREASPTTHVQSGKHIPPFFFTYTTRPKERMAESFGGQLKSAGVPTTLFPSLGRAHDEVNRAVSIPGDPLSIAVFKFLSANGGAKPVASKTATGNPGLAAQPEPQPEPMADFAPRRGGGGRRPLVKLVRRFFGNMQEFS